MSIVNTCCYKPEFRTEHLERLAAFEQPVETENQVWTEVHMAVQRTLAGLDELVRLRVAHLHVKPGKTQGLNFYLFSYVTFCRSDAVEIDPVVVGLTFARGDSEKWVVIDADISGEHTGDMIETLARQTVPADREELLRAAHELASKLSCCGQRIAEALLDSSRSN